MSGPADWHERARRAARDVALEGLGDGSWTDHRRRTVGAAVAGLLTGLAAGLIGVGGGEFRLPVLVRVLGFPLKLAASTNLAVGFLTVSAGTLWRAGGHAWARDEVALVGVMALASVVGALAGCVLRGKLPLRLFRAAMGGYLVAVGLWMIVEALTHTEHVLFEPTGLSRLVLAGAGAWAVAVVSGALGVAGGELRIPMLVYLFGLPLVTAGTLSLAVSIPTVAAAVAADWYGARPPRWAIEVAVVMGVASVGGTLVGAAFLPLVSRDALKGLLGIVLVLATVRLSVGEGGAARGAHRGGR
jgi:putative Mn2+ efflux pump MntP